MATTSTVVTVTPALTASVPVCLICPPGADLPNPPRILSVAQATTTNADGTLGLLLAFGVVQSTVTGKDPIISLNLYRAPTPYGPFTLLVDSKPISNITVVNDLFDLNPVLGVEAYYAATAVDSENRESGLSNVVYYTASRGVVSPSTLSKGAFGPYPVLGSDCYLDPTTREGVIGPNGDLLAVNGLECLAQDLRIRILTEYGEIPMHQDFGFSRGKIIGSGQATREAEAIILVADIKDMLRKEPRVYKVLDVVVNQADPYSWIIGYDIQAIGFEDAAHLNLVVPFY